MYNHHHNEMKSEMKSTFLLLQKYIFQETHRTFLHLQPKLIDIKAPNGLVFDSVSVFWFGFFGLLANTSPILVYTLSDFVIQSST